MEHSVSKNRDRKRDNRTVSLSVGEKKIIMENTFIIYILCAYDQLQKKLKIKYVILILSKFKCRLKEDYHLIKFISISYIMISSLRNIYVFLYSIRIFVGWCGLTSRSSWYFMVKKFFSLCKVHRLVHVARVKWSAIVYRDMQCTENVYRIVQKDEVSFITSMEDGQLRSSMYEQIMIQQC